MERRRVLVTGSSRGIGRAIALRLGQDGWDVVVHCGERPEEAERTAAALGDRFAGMVAADLAEAGLARDLVHQCLKLGRLDAVVNNAGVYVHLDLLEGDDAAYEAAYRRTFAINFAAPLLITRAAATHFRERGHGKIVNVASRVGHRGEAGAALYAASKAALINLTRSLAVELASNNIQVYAIAPGWVETAMVRADVERRLPAILEGIPLGRMASVEDCAGAVSYLLSPDGDYLSGVDIDINGASYLH